MSTHDVPGANPSNGDTLAMGCWAEHADGSLILVQSTESGAAIKDRVVYDIFDMSRKPVLFYRDAMPRKAFDKRYSKPDWTWHDKTPFDWDRVIAVGAPRPQHADAREFVSEAQRVADALGLEARELHEQDVAHRITRESTVRMIDRVRTAISDWMRP